MTRRQPGSDGIYRVGYLGSHPIQYEAPMLRYLATRPELELTVLFLSDMSVRAYPDRGFGVTVSWDVPLREGYRHVFLPCVGRRDRVSLLQPLVIGIRRALRAAQFDALWIHGYAHHAMVRAIAVANSLGLPVLLRGESTLLDRPRGRLRSTLRRSLLPRLFRRIHGFLAIGSLNREFYRAYGVPDDRIFSMPHAVANHFFPSPLPHAPPARQPPRAAPAP